MRQVQKLASKNRRISAASIALEVAEVEGQIVNSQTLRHKLQRVGLHGHHPRRKPLLKLAHKKACKQFAEDNLAKSMNYWNHVLWSDESKGLVWCRWHVWWRPGEEYQEHFVLPTVKHGGGSIMVWDCGSLRETWYLCLNVLVKWCCLNRPHDFRKWIRQMCLTSLMQPVFYAIQHASQYINTILWDISYLWFLCLFWKNINHIFSGSWCQQSFLRNAVKTLEPCSRCSDVVAMI